MSSITLILGIDPGIRNCGLVVINGAGRVMVRETIRNPRAWPLMRCVARIVDRISQEDMASGVVVAEEVVWQGRRGMLPLAHVAGAVVGAAYAMGRVVYLLTPSMKKNGRKPKAFSEHEYDAYLLARRALRPDAVMKRRCTC